MSSPPIAAPGIHDKLQQATPFRRSLIMLTLILSGEAVFLLPFVVTRVFRPTFLDVFGITNFELGSAFSLYGIVAMASYLAGGPLADRFSVRKLLTVALAATAVGGILFARVPGLAMLTALYGCWGLTSILLFWAPLQRATREWGGQQSQGRAFGLLDGGRGLAAAVLASVSVWIFASLLPTDVGTATLAERTDALARIILIYTGLVFGAGLLAWMVVPDSAAVEHESPVRFPLERIKEVLQLRAVWLQAIIVLCAYVSYKSTDDFSLLASDAFGYDDVQAARLGTVSFWVRPFAAMAAGLLADRLDASRVAAGSFLILALGSLAIALGFLAPGIHWVIVATVAATSVGIYGLRGVYFALLGEGKVPLAVTGTAVGLVSFVGYTPDVFMGPLMGHLIDRSPGALGHQHVFALVACFALLGLVASVLFRREVRSVGG